MLAIAGGIVLAVLLLSNIDGVLRFCWGMFKAFVVLLPWALLGLSIIERDFSIILSAWWTFIPSLLWCFYMAINGE